MAYLRPAGLNAYMRQNFVTPQVLADPVLSTRIRIPPGWAPRGMGDYEDTGDYAWEFFPPPYDFLAPSPGDPRFGRIAPEQARLVNGLGCAGGCASCAHGGPCSGSGLGQAAPFPNFYAPFSSSDISMWGWEEWGIILAGGYFAISLIKDIGTGASAVRTYVRKRRRS